jgi:metallo-beta-lactamase family protein
MKLTFAGGAQMVTGSNYVLEHEGASIFVDCGLHQGSNFCERHNWEPFTYDPQSIAAVFVTHAHIDHIGRLPKLVKDGFKGTVYATSATRDMAHLTLLDSEHVLSKEAEKFRLPLLYETADVEALITRWRGIRYHEPIAVGPFRVTFFNAGHILGSAFLLIEVGGKKIIFSGDLGNSPAPLIGPWELPQSADYALIESTYGGRLHEALPERTELLRSMIKETIERKGTLLIPAFATERTQEILFEIHALMEADKLPKIPVFLDSPLAIKMTDVYRTHSDYFTPETLRRAPGEKHPLFEFPGFRKTLSTEESKAINDVLGAKVIIAGSGMSNGGRILHHEKRYLSDPKSTLLIVGYQAKGSLGRQILDGASTVHILGDEIPVHARVKAIGGYSAHADQHQLIEWFRPLASSVKRLFIVQGETEEATALEKKIQETFSVSTHIPDLGEEVML